MPQAYKNHSELPLTLPLRRVISCRGAKVAPTYSNRSGEQVQVLDAGLSCGLVEIWVLRRQSTYYVSQQGRHRSMRSLDVICDWERRSEVSADEWWKPKRRQDSKFDFPGDEWEKKIKESGWVKREDGVWVRGKALPKLDRTEIED